MIVTEGNPGSTVDNSLAGVDFLYRNSRLPGGKLVEAGAWAQESDTDGETADQGAHGIRLEMPNNSGWAGGIEYTKLGEGFDPGLGFLNRPGVKGLEIATEYRHRPREGLFRSILGGIEAERIELLNGELQSQAVEYQLIALENRVGDELSLRYEKEEEQLDEDFEIDDGIVIPLGRYSFGNTRLSLETGDQRKVWGSFDVSNRRLLRRRAEGDRGLPELAAVRPLPHRVRIRVQRYPLAGRGLRHAADELSNRRRVLVEAELGHAHPVRQRVGGHGRQFPAALGAGSRARGILRAEPRPRGPRPRQPLPFRSVRSGRQVQLHVSLLSPRWGSSSTTTLGLYR